MKVFFAASTAELFTYYPVYKKICELVVSLGHTLTRDWLDGALKVQKKNLKVDFDKMYSDIIASILNADVGIVEGTIKGLTTGHQMTVALQKSKPLLYLHQPKGKDMFPFMVSEAYSELFVEKVYRSTREIPQIVEEFLNSQKKGGKVRFNLVLNKSEIAYIEWASFVYKKSKTQIIREIIQRQMKSDTNFLHKRSVRG